MSKRKTCPYCTAKIDYGRRLKAVKSKSKEMPCIKCGKLMRVSYRKSAFFMGVIFFIALIGLNTITLFLTKSRTIIPNLVMTVAFIALYMSIVPTLLRFGEIAGQEDEPPKLKKNRHRHKKDKKQKIEFDENPLKNTTFDK